MGGHGALTLFLKNPGMYKSVSAFAPITNPINCPWGQKAFAGYLGDGDKESWKKHDATELLRGSGLKGFETLIDVGTGDNFYKQGQLLPENFEKAAKESGNESGVVVRYQDVSLLVSFLCVFCESKKERSADRNRDTITHTFSSLPFLLTTLTMPPNTYLHSTYPSLTSSPSFQLNT